MEKRNLALAILSGVVLALAMPRPGWWPASWVGLALLLVAIRGTRPRTAALLGLATGAVYFGIILIWMRLFGNLPWILLALSQAVYFAGFAAVASVLGSAGASRSRYVGLPAAWTAIQWLRSLGTYGFTWGSFAHTQADVTPVIQIASITGPWGIDFLVCLANVSLAGVLVARREDRRIGAAVLSAVVIAAVVFAGHRAMQAPITDWQKFKVAIVQGSLTHAVNPEPGYTAKAFSVYEKLTAQAALAKPDVIVWPETTLPERITDPGWGTVLSALAARLDATLVVGGYDPPEDPDVAESYNSVHVYGPDGDKAGVYHKVHLVPFGEFVPLRDQLPFLRNYGIRDVDVLPGENSGEIAIMNARIRICICFESLFPQITRGGAHLLFVVTNDAWFGRTQAARQHLMMARLRAVENRRYLVRAAASGISAFIDPYGRTISELGLFKQGTLTQEVRSRGELTAYATFGDWFAYLCAGVAALQVVRTARTRRSGD